MPAKQATSGDLAANDFLSNCFRTGLLGNHSVHHRTRDDAFDTAPGGGGSTIESLRAVTEQGAHVDRAAFIRAEMDSERLHGARPVPGTGNRDFPARGGHADVLRGKAQNPDFAVAFQTPATLTLKANHGCTSCSLDVR